MEGTTLCGNDVLSVLTIRPGYQVPLLGASLAVLAQRTPTGGHSIT